MRFAGVSFAVVLAGISSTAHAETPGGFRAEILTGYDSSEIYSTKSGVSYGLGVGYDLPVSDRIAIGVDAEASDATTKDEFSIFIPAPINGVPIGLPLAGPPTLTGTTIQTKTTVGRDLYIGARVTMALSPRFNGYAKVGYTNTLLKSDILVSGSASPFVGPLAPGLTPSPSAFNTSVSDKLNGVRLGIGGQLNIGKNLFASIEYRYSNYEAGFSRNQLIAGLGLRF